MEDDRFSFAPVPPFRWALLMRSIPDLVRPAGRCLYVGASRRRFDVGRELRWAGWEMTLLERWPANYEWYEGHPWLAARVLGDVCDLEAVAAELRPPYDLALWWHGPEHVARADLPTALGNLEGVGARVVLGCPWGVSLQGPEGGNPFEEHLNHLYPADLGAFGYSTATAGTKDGGRASALLAWKRCAPPPREEEP